MSLKTKTALVKFTGVKPLLFDQYQGSNEAKPEAIDKVYWDDQDRAVIPQINIYSALCSENSKSVAKMYYGKKAKPIGMAIQNGLLIEDHLIPLRRNDRFFDAANFDDDFKVVEHVARINKSGAAIPNPKVRPQLDCPWWLQFRVEFMPNGDVTWEVMVQCFQYAGIIGLGTYRPLFGGFRVEIEE